MSIKLACTAWTRHALLLHLIEVNNCIIIDKGCDVYLMLSCVFVTFPCGVLGWVLCCIDSWSLPSSLLLFIIESASMGRQLLPQLLMDYFPVAIIKEEGPGHLGPVSLTWVVVTKRGCLPQNVNQISPTPKSNLGITPIITKACQVTKLKNQNILIFTISLPELFTKSVHKVKHFTWVLF